MDNMLFIANLFIEMRKFPISEVELVLIVIIIIILFYYYYYYYYLYIEYKSANSEGSCANKEVRLFTKDDCVLGVQMKLDDI